MIDENLPVVIIATCDRDDSGSVLRYEKNLANIRGFKQQSARVIAIASKAIRNFPASRTTPSSFHRRLSCCCRFWRSCPCSCSLIT